MPAPGGRSTELGEARSPGLRRKPPLLVTKQGSGVRVRTGHRAAGLLLGTWSGSAEVPCRPAPPAALSEAPYVDGERSFWSTGPGGRICTREDVAPLRTEGLPAAGRDTGTGSHPRHRGPSSSRRGSRFHLQRSESSENRRQIFPQRPADQGSTLQSECEPGGRSQNLPMAENPHSPFPFPQGELFLFFSSDVVLDGTEIIIVFNQEILHGTVITEQCFQTSF